MDKANKPQAGRQMRFTEEELEIIKNSFGGNEDLLRLLRKVFLPEMEPDAPLGQMVDLWMTVNIKDQSPEQALRNIQARNELIMHVEQQLLQLNVLAGNMLASETPEEKQARLKKDSSK